MAAGGAIGASLRWAMEGMVVGVLDARPWATLSVNVLGCLLMGVLVARVLAGRVHRPWVRPLLGTGVLGGFTTFSAYAADASVLARDGAPLLAGLYLAGTLAVCLAAVTLGLRWGRPR